MAQRERGRERAHREAPPGRSGVGDAGEHRSLVAPAEEAEAALAETDRRVELAAAVEVAHVELLERRGQLPSAAAASRASADELGAVVDAHDVDTRAAPSASE